MTPIARSRLARRPPAGNALAAAALVALATGCAVAPPEPAAPPLDELLQQAESSRTNGDRERARQLWHESSRLHPLSARPWRLLAEDHFRAGENGSAIVAAQEAARRDPQDRVALGILAVGGLRVSSTALVALREREGVPADTRGEAAALTRLLRETLGEPVLVPTPEPPQAPARARRVGRASTAATPAASTAAPRAPVATGSDTTVASPGAAAAPRSAATAAAAVAAVAPTGPVPHAPNTASRPALPATARGIAPAVDRSEATAGPRPLVSLPSANPFDRLR